jgi:hypothetical protein
MYRRRGGVPVVPKTVRIGAAVHRVGDAVDNRQFLQGQMTDRVNV